MRVAAPFSIHGPRDSAFASVTLAYPSRKTPPPESGPVMRSLDATLLLLKSIVPSAFHAAPVVNVPPILSRAVAPGWTSSGRLLRAVT